MPYISQYKVFFSITIVAALFLTYFFWGEISSTYLLLWFSTLFIVTTLRVISGYKRHQRIAKNEEYEPWELIIDTLNVSFGMLWGLTSFFSINTGNVIYVSIISIWLIILVIYGMFVLAKKRTVSLIFSLAVITPLIISFQGRSELYSQFSIVIGITFLLIILFYIYNNDLILRLISLVNDEHTEKQNFNLERKNKLLQQIVNGANNLPIFVFEFIEDGNVIYANDASCKHFQKTRESLLKLRMRDFSTKFSNGLLPDDVMASLLAGNLFIFEDEHVLANGERIPVEVTVNVFSDKEELFAINYCYDLRERKALEQQSFKIKEAEAKQQAQFQFKRLVDAYPDPIVLKDLDGKITYMSDAIAAMYGCKAEDMLGFKASELEIRDDFKPNLETLSKAADKVAKENKPFIYEQWIKNNNINRCFEIRHIPEHDNEGNAVGILGFARDITSQAISREILKTIAKSSYSSDISFFDSLTKNMKEIMGTDYVVLTSLDSNESELNIIASSGVDTRYHKLKNPLKDSFYNEVLECNGLHIIEDPSEKYPRDPFLSECKIKNITAITLWGTNQRPLGFLTNFSKHPLREFDASDEVTGLVVNRIVSEFEGHLLEETKKAREEDFRVLVEGSPDFISRFDIDMNCLYVNPAAAKLGFKTEAKLGFTTGNKGRQTELKFRDQIKSVLKSGIDSTKIYFGVDPNNEQFNTETRAICERNKNGDIVGVIVISRDISERVKLETKLRKQAGTDSLTQLTNRRAFTEKLQFALANAKRDNNIIGLLFIDLDRFKEINDTLGHDIGDELLKEAARRLQNSVRESDLVARFGGDEFVVLLSSLDDPLDCGSIAQTIINTLKKPYYLDSVTSYISASIGISSYPNDSKDAKSLIAYADQAMYAAKQDEKSMYHFFTPEMQTEAENRLLLLNDLRFALENKELEVVFQPILDSHSEKITKAEALLRWVHKDKGLIQPDNFIPLAEDTGLIDPIGDWVFHQSANFARVWQQQSNEHIQVSVNVSSRQFNQESIVEKWLNYLNEINLKPNHITLELTESLLLGEQSGLQKKLTRFREAGIELALDDFGTGYSAMSYLKKFPLDYLKIDGSFIRDMVDDSQDCAIAETIAAMALKLGMKSIAECVETQEQHSLLLSYGCNYIQGYLYSKPLSQKAFLKFVKTKTASN